MDVWGVAVTPLIVGVLLGFALAVPGLVYLARELRIAQDRLLTAWKEGAVVPPREDKPTQNPPLEPLPPQLQPFVDQWESPASRESEEARIRQWLAQGWSIERLVKHLADPPDARPKL